MTRLNLILALLVSTTIVTSNNSCFADHDVSIKDGFGEEITVKKNLFGQKQTIVKDRLGDKVETKTSSSGTKETQVNVFGNIIQNKKSWLGSSDFEATSILGDKIISKKDKLGRRTTTVDLSGLSAVLQSFFAEKKPANNLSTSPQPEQVNSSQGNTSTADLNQKSP